MNGMGFMHGVDADGTVVGAAPGQEKTLPNAPVAIPFPPDAFILSWSTIDRVLITARGIGMGSERVEAEELKSSLPSLLLQKILNIYRIAGIYLRNINSGFSCKPQQPPWLELILLLHLKKTRGDGDSQDVVCTTTYSLLAIDNPFYFPRHPLSHSAALG